MSQFRLARLSLLVAAIGFNVLPALSHAQDAKPAAAAAAPGKLTVNSVTVKDGTVIHFKDWGTGTPVTLWSCSITSNSSPWRISWAKSTS